MKKIITKFCTWLFREKLQLQNHWWHRLIKVIFLVIFFITSIGAYIGIMIESDRLFLNKHNITVNNSIIEFTEKYEWPDNINTIPKFFEQKGKFGVWIEDKLDYVSLYSLWESICLKSVEKNIDIIVDRLYQDYQSRLNYWEKGIGYLAFNDWIKKNLEDNPNRKCYFYNFSTYDQNLENIENLSENIINYKPNFLFYLEITIAVSLVALLSFILFALVYYHLILYIVYGSKK